MTAKFSFFTEDERAEISILMAEISQIIEDLDAQIEADPEQTRIANELEAEQAEREEAALRFFGAI